MNVRVLGCSGGESLTHRNVSILIDHRVALDAGNLTSALTLQEQTLIEAVLATHSHMDHVGDLGNLVDTRAQQRGPAILVGAMAETVAALRAHFFNDVLWPDFTRLPTPDEPAMELRTLGLETEAEVCGYGVRALAVHHSVPSCGFVVSDGMCAVAYSGDTGSTDRFWEAASGMHNLRLIITEVSFPDREAHLARVSGHLTPSTLAGELRKLGRAGKVPVGIYGLKPVFDAEIRDELAALKLGHVRVLTAGEELTL